MKEDSKGKTTLQRGKEKKSIRNHKRNRSTEKHGETET
jgi:hypothetical protein